MNAVTDSLSVGGLVQYLESHPITALIFLVILVAVLIIMGKLARWLIRPILKGVVAGVIVFAALYFLNLKELLTISKNWMILIAVGLAVLTAVVDLNRKE
jgi:hypothetical protein